jgi:hypothetical protein
MLPPLMRGGGDQFQQAVVLNALFLGFPLSAILTLPDPSDHWGARESSIAISVGTTRHHARANTRANRRREPRLNGIQRETPLHPIDQDRLGSFSDLGNEVGDFVSLGTGPGPVAPCMLPFSCGSRSPTLPTSRPPCALKCWREWPFDIRSRPLEPIPERRVRSICEQVGNRALKLRIRAANESSTNFAFETISAWLPVQLRPAVAVPVRYGRSRRGSRGTSIACPKSFRTTRTHYRV